MKVNELREAAERASEQGDMRAFWQAMALLWSEHVSFWADLGEEQEAERCTIEREKAIVNLKRYI